MKCHCICIAQTSVGTLFSKWHKIFQHKQPAIAAGHFSFFFQHCSILHCISQTAETMHLDLHTLINIAFPAGKGQHQLTFPSCLSACASNNNIASQQELIMPQWHLCEMQPWRSLQTSKAVRDRCVDLEHLNKASKAKANSGNKSVWLVDHHVLKEAMEECGHHMEYLHMKILQNVKAVEHSK